MNHTLSSLLALATSDDGKQQIRVMVAERLGWQNDPRPMSLCSIPIQDSMPWVDPDNIRRHSHDLPPYHTSLDAIMPEVQKLPAHARNDYNQHLWLACGNEIGHFAPWGEWFQRALYSVATAEPVHHCITLLLTLQA